jgi:hypothetical protein
MAESVIPTCKGLKKGQQCIETKLCNAHIIPAGFARFVRNESSHNLELNAEGSRRSRHQLGIFDSNILCADCDRALGVYDEYALQICKNFNGPKLKTQESLFALPDTRGEIFAKFVLSVLWRASISKRPEYSAVALGKYEEIACRILFGENRLSDMPAFQLMLRRYFSSHIDCTRFYSLPIRMRNAGWNGYGFGLAGFQIIAKIDSRPFPSAWRPYIINENNVLRGMFVELEKTGEFEMLANSAVAELRQADKT